MTDTTKRDEVLGRFTRPFGEFRYADPHDMADRIVELEATVERQDRILAALREPSVPIQAIAFMAFEKHDDMEAALVAAVAAAEREVDRG